MIQIIVCQHDQSNWRAVAIIFHFLKTSQIFTPRTGYYNIIKFPTRITAKVITLKHSLINAVLLIVTELLLSHFTSPPLVSPKGSVSLFLTFPTDMDKILFVFPLDQQLWPWTNQHVPMNCHSLSCIGYEFRMTVLGSDVHSLVNPILCSAVNVPSFKLQRNKNFIQCLNLFLCKILPRMVIYFNIGLIYQSELVKTV